jgi:hypothetical protein
MWKCYGAPVAKTKAKSSKAKPAVRKAPRPAPKAARAARSASRTPKSAPTRTTAVRPSQALKPARTAPAVKPPAAAPLPPPPPPPRDELLAPRDIARLTRYGERFGPHKIDVRTAMRADALPPGLPLQLPVASGSFALFDPGVPKSWRVLDRPAGSGQFRVMLSIARTDEQKERLAAVVIHVGRPPIAKWTVAHYKGQKKPKSADQLPRCPVTTGWIAVMDAGQGSPGVVAVPPAAGLLPVEIPLTDGRRALAMPCGNGEYVAYWAVDATDKPICLVIDFDTFTQKEWKARSPT